MRRGESNSKNKWVVSLYFENARHFRNPCPVRKVTAMPVSSSGQTIAPRATGLASSARRA